MQRKFSHRSTWWAEPSQGKCHSRVKFGNITPLIACTLCSFNFPPSFWNVTYSFPSQGYWILSYIFWDLSSSLLPLLNPPDHLSHTFPCRLVSFHFLKQLKWFFLKLVFSYSPMLDEGILSDALVTSLSFRVIIAVLITHFNVFLSVQNWSHTRM